ncbi:hypothetical protein D8S82_33210, partial [Mycobacterium hodleri]
MSIERPTGTYKSQMTTPPEAWPTADEDTHGRRAGDLLKVALRLDAAASSWARSFTSIFDGNTWFGNASDAGKAKVQAVSDKTESVGTIIADSAAFHRHVAESIMNAKKHIVDICDAAQKVIDEMNSRTLSSQDDQQQRENAIREVIDRAYRANSAVVTSAGAAINTGQIYPPAADKDIPDFGSNIPSFSGPKGAIGGISGPASPPSLNNAADQGGGVKGAQSTAQAPPPAGAPEPAVATKGNLPAEPAAAPANSAADPQVVQNAGYTPPASANPSPAPPR